MTKVRFFLGDDTEPFILNQPTKTTKLEQDYKKIIFIFFLFCMVIWIYVPSV